MKGTSKALLGEQMSSWLSSHLEGFVKPVLGYIPNLPKGYTRFFSPKEMSIIKNLWRSVKNESVNKPILLAGRDVYIFYVLAMREGKEVTFRPDISRLTVDHIREDYTGYYLFDTGFIGSIPKGLSIPHYKMVSATLGVSNRELLREPSRQVFPRLQGARGLALKIERTPKYWKRAFNIDNRKWNWSPTSLANVTTGSVEIGQELTEPEEFLRAAHLTIEVYTDSSPKFYTEPNVGKRYFYESSL
jgi:hypothetical protein